MTALAGARDAALILPLDVAGTPRRLVPMVVGFEVIREDVSVAGASAFRHVLEPVTAAAVVFDEGWVLLDGGFDPARVRDRERRRAAFDYENYAPVVPAGDPLHDQVAAAGLDWNELAGAAISHAHFDHTGAVRMLRPEQPVLLQRREWEHVLAAPDPRGAFLFRDDLVRDDRSIVLLDGDTELAPGLRALDTSGHTPGHQSFAVDLPDRTVVLACDAADLRRNIDEVIPTGSTVGLDGDERALRAIRRLHDLDRSPGVQVWPGHDPDWPAWREVVDALA
jgi:N-acyl homoserine lactone hydrolase